MATNLLSFYETVSKCPLSILAYHNALANSLRKLLTDVELLVPALLAQVQSIQSKFEASYGSSSAPATVSSYAKLRKSCAKLT